MIYWIIFGAFTAIFIGSFLREKRAFRNSIFLALSLASLFVAAAYATNGTIVNTLLNIVLYAVIPLILLFISFVFIYAGVIAIKRERFSLAHSLSIAFGVGIWGAFVAVAVTISAKNLSTITMSMVVLIALIAMYVIFTFSALFIYSQLYYFIQLITILYSTEEICYTPIKTVLEDADMPRYIVTLTNDEIQELKALIQKGGKGYRIKHAQILLKLDQKPENKAWTYDRIKDAYGASRSTIAGVAQRFVMEGMEAALGRKVQENRRRKVTGDVEARICAIACSEPPKGTSRWTMQAIADELIRLEVVDYITDSTVCEVMKKTKSSRGS